MTTDEFDAKLNELRAIESRMKRYTDRTPISSVTADRTRAHELHKMILAGLSEIRSSEQNLSDL